MSEQGSTKEPTNCVSDTLSLGFEGGSVERIHLQCRRLGFDPWVRKSPGRRKQQPTPVLLPGRSHGGGACALHSPGLQRVGHNLLTEHTRTCMLVTCITLVLNYLQG